MEQSDFLFWKLERNKEENGYKKKKEEGEQEKQKQKKKSCF